jgi:hypothetical protein
MANVNAPYGLKAVRHSTGGNVQTNDYPINPTYTTAIFSGDVVKGNADGTINVAAAGEAAPIGVFCGCTYVNAQGLQKYSQYWTGETGATNIVAHVYDDPNIIFQAQANATGLAATDLNNLTDMDTYAAGNTRTGKSACVLSGTVGTTGKAFRVLRLINDGVNVAGAYANVEVIFVQHALRGVVSGVGGV